MVFGTKSWWQFAAGVAAAALTVPPVSLWAQDGALQTIRDDVRQGAPASPSPPSSSDSKRDYNDNPVSNGTDPADDGGWPLEAIFVAGIVAASPFYLPMTVMGDGLSTPGYFLSFPYDGVSGYVTSDALMPGTCFIGGRFDADYVANFDRLDNFGGHLLLETSPRFGLDARANYLEERLSGGGRDELWLGDCNLVYRFAQSDWGEFRTGLGLNWLDDATRADLGFNFIYAADFFPMKPWVVSATLDAGTLGRAALFRFRGTAGVMINRFELYTGYEYSDIERTHWNGLVGGVSVWF
jgi:hypothetical protein